MSSDWIAHVPPGVSRAQPQVTAPAAVSAPGPTYVVERERPSAPAPDRVRALEAELQKEREDRLKKEAAYEREKLESVFRRENDQMKEELRRLTERLAQPQQSPVENEIVRSLKEQNDRLLHSLEERKREESGNAMMAMVSQMMQQMQTQAQQSQQQMQMLLMKMGEKPAIDPVVTLLLENSRAQQESAREYIRQQADMARENARSAMGPRDLVDLTEKLRASSGVDSLLKSTTEAFQSVFSLQKNALEMMRDINQGPSTSPLMEMAGNAINGVQEMAKGYFRMKSETAMEIGRAHV